MFVKNKQPLYTYLNKQFFPLSLMDYPLDSKFKFPHVQKGLIFAFESFPDGIALFEENGAHCIHNKKFLEFYPFLSKLFNEKAENNENLFYEDIIHEIARAGIEKINPSDSVLAPLLKPVNTSDLYKEAFGGQTAISWQERYPNRSISQVFLYTLPNASKILLIKDISSNIAHIEHFKELALTDALTQISNRGCFSFRLTELFQNHTGDLKIAVLLIDLNDFKGINDTYGHAAGDCILKEVADRLKQHIRGAHDLVARLGGDEFGILLNGVKNEEEIKNVINRFRTDLEDTPYKLPIGKQIKLTASIGVSLFPNEEMFCPQTLVVCADQAMYQAKKQYKEKGTNLTCFYAPKIAEDLEIVGATSNTLKVAPSPTPWFKSWRRSK